MRTVKFKILANGHITSTSPSAPRGYGNTDPVIEIAGVPDNVSDAQVMATYRRCIIMPVMHANNVIAWGRIEGAHQGQIIHLTRGRPAKDASEKAVRVNISLSPDALALIDAQDGNRSTLIEQLIVERWGHLNPPS